LDIYANQNAQWEKRHFVLQYKKNCDENAEANENAQ